MKTADVAMTWRACLDERGPAAAVTAIRDLLLAEGANGRAGIGKALELLFATLPPDGARRLASAIAEDARALRETQANEHSDSARTTALRNKFQALQARVAELKGGRSESDEFRGRLGALAEQEKLHRDAISQLASESSRLATALQRLNGS